jgi:hypothetical protein
VWQRGNTAGGGFAAITGATAETYALAAADLGKYIRVTVSRADNSGTRISAAMGPVEDPPSHITITIGFNESGAIVIGGDDGTNNIYKSSLSPASIVFTAVGEWTDVAWNVNGDPVAAGNENSLTIDAGDYAVKPAPYSLTFRGKKDGVLYSKTITFKVNY